MSGRIALETSQISVNETAGTVLVPIVRTGDLSKSVEIIYEATFLNVDDPAGAADFTPVFSSVTMAAGDDRVVVPIEILDDNLSEETEAFSFSLVDLDSGTFLFPRTVQIDILDDENPVEAPTFPELKSAYSFRQDTVISGLTKPIAFEASPFDKSIVYIAEKNGKVRLFDIGTGEDLGDVVDIMDQVNQRGDRGMMDLALHPDLANFPYLYTFYTVDPPDTAGKSGNAAPDGEGNRFAYLTRHTLDADNDYRTVVPGSEVILVGAAGKSLSDISGNGTINSTSNFDAPASDVDPETGDYVQDYIKVDSLSHAGGSIEFGPDGALYVSTGDGTSYNAMDVRALSVQSIDALAGKILRIDPVTGLGLADNPFVAEAGGDLTQNAAKVYQLGLRNPFTMSFDDEGRLLIADVGWGLYEEINSSGPGANFGWPFYEGGDGGKLLETRDYMDLDEAKDFYDAVADGDEIVTPAFKAFSHRFVDPGFQVQAMIGANDVIDTAKFPDGLQGRYLFTDIPEGEVYAINVNDSRDVEFLADTKGSGPVHLKLGADGHMYFVYLIEGTIKRVSFSELGTAGDDTLAGSGTRDIISGLSGDDNIVGRGAGDLLAGNRGSDTLNGGKGGDDLSGGMGADMLYGNRGNDLLAGGQGKDSLFGGNGSDELSGDRGRDLLSGGSGQDAFVFGKDFGRDTIQDFQDNVDTIHLDDDLWTGTLNKSQIIDQLAEVGRGKTRFDFGDDVLVIDGITNAQDLRDDIVII